MLTFAMTLLTIMTVAGAAIIGWLSRYWWTARQGVDPATLKARNLGVAIGTVAVGTAAMRYDDGETKATGTGDPATGSPSGLADTGERAALRGDATAGAAASDEKAEIAQAKAEASALRARLGSAAADIPAATAGDLAAQRAEATQLRQALFERSEASGAAGGADGESSEISTHALDSAAAETATRSGGGSEADAEGAGQDSKAHLAGSSGDSGSSADDRGGASPAPGSDSAALSADDGGASSDAMSQASETGATGADKKALSGSAETDGGRADRMVDRGTSGGAASPAGENRDSDGSGNSSEEASSSDDQSKASAISGGEGSDAKAKAEADGFSGPSTGGQGDDLTAIRGIGPALQDQLNARGIATYADLAALSPGAQAALGDALGFTGRVEREDWVAQAHDLLGNPAPGQGTGGREARLGVLANAGRALGSLNEAEEDAALSEDEAAAMRLIESGDFVADESNRPTVLLDAAPAEGVDDLKVIKGVGPKLEGLLNGLGVYQFSQIAAFSATDIAWVDSKLSFKGRIVRDRWVDQARDLAG